MHPSALACIRMHLQSPPWGAILLPTIFGGCLVDFWCFMDLILVSSDKSLCPPLWVVCGYSYADSVTFHDALENLCFVSSHCKCTRSQTLVRGRESPLGPRARVVVDPGSRPAPCFLGCPPVWWFASPCGVQPLTD